MQLELKGISAFGTLRHALSHLVTNALECAMPTREMHVRHARYLNEFYGRHLVDEKTGAVMWPGGDPDLAAITYAQVRRYLDDEHRRGVAKETIRKRLSTLHMALCEAVRMGWLVAVPPWPVIKTDTRPKEAFWTMEQWEAADRECDDDDLRTWILCGWWTGMHSSDLDRFRWDDVELAAETPTWVRRNTKTKVKPVRLPLPKVIADRLRERYTALQPHKRDLIAARRMGHPNRPLKALCHRAGVPLLSPIGLRHSCETFLEERGTTELFQMTWLGLSSPRMLKKHYRHITPPTLDRGISLLNNAA